MADAETSPTQFEFYEGIRILLPGAIAVGLANEISRTFGLGFRFENNPIGGIAAAILIGLIFYYVDAPSKAAVYYQDLPTEYLRASGITVPREFKLINLYFVLYDEVVPRGIRARGLYMGSMYRIGLEGIYMLLLSSVSVLCSAVILADQRLSHIQSIHASTIPAMVGIAAAVVFVPYSAELERRRRRRSGNLFLEIADAARQFRKADVAFVSLVVLLLAIYFIDFRHLYISGIFSVALVTMWWSVRYFRGRESVDAGGHKRIPLNRVSAVIAGSMVVLATELVTLGTVGSARISVVSYWEWTGLLVLALALICARGHEKRLGGSYATQNTWLALHRSELDETYFAGRAPKELKDVETEEVDSDR